MVDGIPTSDHNEALSGDTLYSAFLNHEWREIVVAAVVEKMNYLASTITDESELQDFEVRYGALIDDLYNEEIVDGTPVGTIIFYIGVTASIPAKWLKCEGQTLDGDDYPDLRNVLDTPFDDNTNLYIPDLREKFLYGASSNADLGDTGGAATHTLTTAELPAHTHTVARGNNIGNSATTVVEGDNNAPSTATSNTGSAGSGNSHNNMPPYMRGYWIIKVLP